MAGKADLEFAILLPTLLLAVAIGASLFAIIKARRYHYEHDLDEAESPEAQLERYRQLAEEGELDPKELEAIEAKIKGEAKPEPPPQEPAK